MAPPKSTWDRFTGTSPPSRPPRGTGPSPGLLSISRHTRCAHDSERAGQRIVLALAAALTVRFSVIPMEPAPSAAAPASDFGRDRTQGGAQAGTTACLVDVPGRFRAALDPRRSRARERNVCFPRIRRWFVSTRRVTRSAHSSSVQPTTSGNGSVSHRVRPTHVPIVGKSIGHISPEPGALTIAWRK